MTLRPFWAFFMAYILAAMTCAIACLSILGCVARGIDSHGTYTREGARASHPASKADARVHLLDRTSPRAAEGRARTSPPHTGDSGGQALAGLTLGKDRDSDRCSFESSGRTTHPKMKIAGFGLSGPANVSAGVTSERDPSFACCQSSLTKTGQSLKYGTDGPLFSGGRALIGSTQGNLHGAVRTLDPLGKGWPPSDFAGSGDTGRSVGVPGPHRSLEFGVVAARKDVPETGGQGFLHPVGLMSTGAGIKARPLLQAQGSARWSSVRPRERETGKPARVPWPVASAQGDLHGAAAWSPSGVNRWAKSNGSGTHPTNGDEDTLSTDGSRRFTAQGREVVLPSHSASRAGIKPGPHHFLALSDSAARLCGVPADLLRALVARESSWRQDVTSSSGAVGLAQVKPSTAREISPTLDIRQPFQNLLAGACYLRRMYDREGSWAAALLSYRLGPYRRRTTIEAHAYVADIMEAAQ